ncbi:hypothetical protein R6Q59_019814 [Mikania micrantha]
MKLRITQQKDDPITCNGFPDLPAPFLPMNSVWKLSAVLGAMLANSSIMIWPVGEPPTVMSKDTLGFAIPDSRLKDFPFQVHDFKESKNTLGFTINPSDMNLD